MKLFGITICINYSDYLECVIGNARHFDRWLVVTVPEDTRTQELCAKHGVEVFLSTVLQPDGKDFDAAYNKARVLNEALCVVESGELRVERSGTASTAFVERGGAATSQLSTTISQLNWVLLLDADILLPRDFRERVEGLPLVAGTLYGAAGRKIVQERGAFEQIREVEPWTTLVARNSNVIGYLNLFCMDALPNRYPVREPGTKKGGHDDWNFTMSFAEDRRSVLPMTVIHTGWPWTNWSGRKSGSFERVESLELRVESPFPSQLSTTPSQLNAAVVGYFPGGRWRALVKECAQVWMVDHFQVHTPSGNPLEEADRAVLRRLFAEETAGMESLTMLGAHGLEQLAQIPDGTLDLLVLPGEVAPDWLATALPQWQSKLREGAVVCGDLFGHPWWREATFSLALLLGAPDGVSADGRWWKRMSKADRKLVVPPEPDSSSDGVVLVNRSKETLDALMLSLFSVRKHWAGSVQVVHWGEENLSLTVACAQLGVTLRCVGDSGADMEDWPAGVSQPFKRALVVQPGMLAVAALDGVFAARCAMTEEFAPLLVEDGEVMAAQCGCAREYRYGTEAMLVFSTEPETWTDAAWQMHSELEAEAAIAMAATVRVPEDTTIVCIITRDEMEDFQRNWLTWRFPVGTPVLLLLAEIEQEELWIPSMNAEVQIAELNEKQAHDAVWLLRTLSHVCRTKRVVFLPAGAAALPGADLWVNIAEEDTAQHCSKMALNEVQVTGNRFVPKSLFAMLPVAHLLNLADAAEAAGASVDELSLLLPRVEANIRMQDMIECGWAVESAHSYLPPDGVRCESTKATETLRERADGLLQFADDVVVISLPERTDRRERMEYMMAREGVWFRFVDGLRVKDEEIEPEEISEVGRESFKMAAGFKKYLRGMVGCRRAHLRVLEAAKAKGLRSLMIIEDDMVLESGWLEKLRAALADLPKGWLQLHFSAMNFKPSAPVSKNLRRLGGTYQTTAILYSAEGIEAALQCLRHSRNEIDYWMGLHLHPFGNSYVIHPRIAFQKGGVSDIMSYDRGVTA